MPTVLFLSGWRFFFYSDERDEPVHIHCRKAEKECKFWIFPDEYDIELVYQYNLAPRDIRFLRKAVFQNFEYIIEEWNTVQGG